MHKVSLNNFLTRKSTHRIPKIATLAVMSCVLVAMVNIDASASSYTGRDTSALRSSVVETLSSNSSGSQFAGLVRRWHPINSTGTTSSSTTVTTTSIGTGAGGGSASGGGASTGGSTATTASTTTTSTTAPSTTTTTTLPPATTTSTTSPSSSPASSPSTAWPIGTPSSSEPSGYAPPAANALSGYSEEYESDFTGSTLPSAWDPYSGQPGGDSGALFDPANVTVANGLLNINTSLVNNEWETGGTCLCNSPNLTYGAYFVRSRMTGPGPTGVELLWPTGSWPPEIDFNETYGTTDGTSATLHYGSANLQIQRTVSTDMTQWHTWGVIWTPTSITYTLDGTVWGTVTQASAIPNGPMYLSLQSQTWCSSNWACPTSPQSMQVDWVAEYTPSS